MKVNKLFNGAITVFISLHMAYKASKAKKKYNLKIEDNDTNNAVDSMFKARPLYKSLIARAHPDRVTDLESKNLLEDVSKKVTEHRYNYAELKEIEILLNNTKF